MSPSIIKLVLLFLTLALSMFSGYWLRGVLDENKQLKEYLVKVGEAFVLQGKVYEASTKLTQLEEEARSLRKRKFDKATVRYVQSIGANRCLSSPEFVQLYNSTIPTPDTTK